MEDQQTSGVIFFVGEGVKICNPFNQTLIEHFPLDKILNIHSCRKYLQPDNHHRLRHC